MRPLLPGSRGTMCGVMIPDFEQKLDRYAELAIRVGVNLQPGQRLLLRAPVVAAPFVRRLAEKAYRTGAPLVDVMWSDEGVERARYRFAPDDSFEEVPPWRVDGAIAAVNRGDALLSVVAGDPRAFQGLDSRRIATSLAARQRALRPYSDKTMRGEVAWSLAAVPVPGWAQAVFPDLAPDEALEHLWEAVLQAVRADRPNTLDRWSEHLAQIDRWSDRLNARRYQALHFRAPGTDLRVGLIDGHRWDGGAGRTPQGISFVSNLPTEEVFTAPHRERVDGVVSSSKPLAYNGQLIEGMTLVFEGGAVVKATAESGEEALRGILDTDEGARRLGEVALVPNSSPTSRTGVLYLETLFDENAACHLALGEAYPDSVHGGLDLGRDEALSRGLNDSLAHVDFMIGSAELDVDGVREDGEREAVMRSGEWAF